MHDFLRRVDLAAERVGGAALWATDDFFAAKENLLRPGRGEFVPGKYTERGKWMDGWESRRKRDPGHDWCLIKLGLPGVVGGVDIDTNNFLGNAPSACSLDAYRAEGHSSTEALLASDVSWTEILPTRAVQPGAQNLFAVVAAEVFTHVRLHIYPDGGVARLRVYGEVVPDWQRLLAEHRVLDLAAVQHGGVVLAASDEFFSDRRNLILPGPAVNMGDGWETRRRRGPGHDWVVVQLGCGGTIKRVQIDTTHFRGNFPESCSLEACALQKGAQAASLDQAEWKEVLPRTRLEAHNRHTFDVELVPTGVVTHVRLNIYPDGGVARLRVFAEPVEQHDG